MDYITPAYYLEVYRGEPAPEQELMRYIARATDVVDQLTRYRLTKPLASYPEFVQNQVKKATCAQVEFFILNGLHPQSGHVTIGKFSYQSAGKTVTIPKSVAGFLYPTGLLYTGLAGDDHVDCTDS